MPRGMNPNSQKNLIQNSGRSPNELRKNGAAGGVASGASRRAKGLMKQAFMDGVSESDAAAIVKAHVAKAKRGNDASTRLIIEMLGEKPVDILSAEEQKARIAHLKAQTERLKGDGGNDELQKLDQVLNEIKGVV